jgi:hypothetical protein
MQIRISGEHSIFAIRQALFEILSQAESEYGVRYTLDATLYIRPTNGFGDEYIPYSSSGRPVSKLFCNGPYPSAAAQYEIDYKTGWR